MPYNISIQGNGVPIDTVEDVFRRAVRELAAAGPADDPPSGQAHGLEPVEGDDDDKSFSLSAVDILEELPG